MHRSHLVNRDIKMENMLVGAAPDYQILLNDYGFVKALEGDKKNLVINTRLGTPGYMPPEILEEQKGGYNGVAVDIYSLGVTLFAIVTRTMPFSSLSYLN